jgi:hypothetical protein
MGHQLARRSEEGKNRLQVGGVALQAARCLITRSTGRST